MTTAQYDISKRSVRRLNDNNSVGYLLAFLTKDLNPSLHVRDPRIEAVCNVFDDLFGAVEFDHLMPITQPTSRGDVVANLTAFSKATGSFVDHGTIFSG